MKNIFSEMEPSEILKLSELQPLDSMWKNKRDKIILNSGLKFDVSTPRTWGEWLNDFSKIPAGEYPGGVEQFKKDLHHNFTESLKNKFSEGQLYAFIDMMNGYFPTPNHPEFIIFNFEDGCEYESLEKKWDIDKEQTLKVMKMLSPKEWSLLQDFCLKFWKNSKIFCII